MNKVVSLFAGIGGFDIAFKKAGFEIVWANDFDKYAVQTYKANVGNEIVLGDILDLKNNIPNHDILCGGFPCQPFSTLGELKGFKDERGTLFFHIIEIAKKHKTKILVLENVKNLINHDNKNTFNRMLKELRENGYDVVYQVLNTQDFGIPQRRNRVFIIAFLKSFFKDVKDFSFPNSQKSNLTLQDLLDKDVDEKYFISTKMIKTILGKGTKGYIVNPKIDEKIAKTLTATMHKCHRASQDNYVTDEINFNKFKNSDKTNIRRLTPDECRKLQGFPDNWKQVVSDTQAYKQFGNAVSVNVVYELAMKLRAFIKKFDN